MAAPGVGYKGFFQFGRETAWGTIVAATHRYPAVSIKLAPEVGIIKQKGIDGKVMQVAAVAAAVRARATIDLELCYTGALLLLDWIHGTGTFGSNGGTTTGSNPYTHVFKQRDLLNSYTCEFGMGGISTAAKCFRMEGAKVARAAIRWSAGLAPDDGVVRMRLELVGEVILDEQTPTTSLTAPAWDPLVFHQITTDDDGISSAGNIKSFELTVDNNLLAERDRGGSQFVDEPVRGGWGTVQMKLGIEFQTVAAFDAFLALTQGSPQVIFTSAAKVATFDIPKAYLNPYDLGEQGPGEITQTLTWDAIDDGGTPPSGLTTTIVNAQTTIIS